MVENFTNTQHIEHQELIASTQSTCILVILIGLFPHKFYKTIGYTIYGFSFKFKYAPSIIASILNPARYLINAESCIEDIENTLTDEIFYSIKKDIKKK